MIRTVMERIDTQTIPDIVVNNPNYDWNPYTNEVKPTSVKDFDESVAPAATTASNAAEPNTRYAKVLTSYRAARKVDAYSPTAPTHIARSFNEGREIPE